MRYHALACDYDGTVATHGSLDAGTRTALQRLRATGRKLLLVTGRKLDDLERVCPGLEIFDAIVAENGGVLYRPSSRQTRVLGPPPPPAFEQALRAHGVQPVDSGRVIVSTWQPHETVVLDTIRELGLELQVVFNKGAVMILPSGINKATGLEAALGDLGMSPHNTVGVGDAENDHAFLSRCECAVAVGNAIPSLKAEADLVTDGVHGAGVAELIEMLLEDDLASLAPRLDRHDIPLGHDETGALVTVPAYGSTVLVAGTSGGGKSTVVTGLIERMGAKSYQHCIIDPEGDYASYAGGVVLGDARQPPTVESVMDVVSGPARNVVVNLLALGIDQRPAFCTTLLSRLLELRARTGRVHWIVLDETHHLLPESWQSVAPVFHEEKHGMVMVTVHPKHVAPVAMRAVDLVLTIGREPGETLRTFAATLNVPAPPVTHQDLQPGEVLAWWPGSGNPPKRLRTLPSVSERKRHARKYAEGELGPDKSFYFRGPRGRLNLRAQNLRFFLQEADGVDAKTWLYHLRRGDYSRWVRESIKDDGLADEIAAVEASSKTDKTEKPAEGRASESAEAADSRAAVRAAVEARYTAPA
jgi:hydroxymethylpyrimidine pyrophosphatase-like HAD family hydrolase